MGSTNTHSQASDGPGLKSFHEIQPGARWDRARDKAEDKATAQGLSPSRRQDQKQVYIQHISKEFRRQPANNTGSWSIPDGGSETGLQMHTQTQAVICLAFPCTLKVVYSTDRPPDSDILLIMGILLHICLIVGVSLTSLLILEDIFVFMSFYEIVQYILPFGNILLKGINSRWLINSNHSLPIGLDISESSSISLSIIFPSDI